MQFFRVSDPDPSGAMPAEPGDEDDATAPVWTTVYNWLSGAGSAAAKPASAAEVAELRAALFDGEVEVTRVKAAYQLGAVLKGGNADAAAAAAGALGEALSGAESVRRAASYGLAQGGDKAVPVILAALGSGTLSQQASCSAVHALGQAAEDPSAEAVDAVVTSAETALRELDEYAQKEAREASGNPRGEVYSGAVAVDHYANERRRMLATCAQAAGIMGQRLARSGAAGSALCERLTALAIGLASGEEPGLAFPSYMKSVMVRENAAHALLRISSASSSAPPEPMVCTPEMHTGWDDPQGSFLPQMVGIAQRRLEAGEETALQRKLLALFDEADWPWEAGAMVAEGYAALS